MATRSSKRLAALSPSPLFPPPNMSTDSKSRLNRPPVSTAEWNKMQLDEFSVEVTETSQLDSIVPKEFTTETVTASMQMPETFFSEHDGGLVLEKDELAHGEALSKSTDSARQQGDLLVRGYFDTLQMIQRMFLGTEGGEEINSMHGSEEYTKQLLYDFVRILFLSNRTTLGKSEHGKMQISPPCRTTFHIAGTEYVVVNDGCVKLASTTDNDSKSSSSIPISFEARQYHLTDDADTRANKIPGQVLAQLFSSVLSSDIDQDAYVLHIQKTKVYIYHGRFPSEYLQQVRNGSDVSSSVKIERYPKDGFDLSDKRQRKDLCTAVFSIFKYCISGEEKIGRLNEEQKIKEPSIKDVVVINGPTSEGERFLDSLPQSTATTRKSSPRRLSPRRSPSPKRQSSPKRKHTAEEGTEPISPRPAKRPATEDSISPVVPDTKPAKLNSFGFGAKLTSSPWSIPSTSETSPVKPSQPAPAAQPVKKVFGFSAAAAGVSPFSAAAQSTSAWSGWDSQKTTSFEKKSLFGSSKPTPPPKKETPAEKKYEDGVSEDEGSGDENGGEESGEEDLESELENGDGEEKSTKNVDMRAQAGEAHEETLFETTCTLYETDPKTSSWVSKGTGIIHVNVDKDSNSDPKNSRLIMRQQGTMKVMWNIRLFKGMQLLPRQVSEGDRRMDVYVKMVLVDNGQPKSYAIKLRNHTIMDQLYSAIKKAIPS